MGFLMVISCGAKKEIVIFNPVTKESFSSRENPAETGAGDEKYYIDKGYIRIGTLSVKHVNRVCFDSCEDISHSYDLTDVLKRHAAQKGGDVIVITQDKVKGSEKARKNGACKRSHLDPRMTQSYHPAPMGSNQAGYYTTEVQWYPVCDEYDIIEGKQDYTVSSGEVWRRRE
jgi:hypothetical protein